MLTRLQLVKQIFPRFVEAEVSLPRSQQPAPLVPILSQIISIHTQPSYFFQVFLYTITFSFCRGIGLQSDLFTDNPQLIER